MGNQHPLIAERDRINKQIKLINADIKRWQSNSSANVMSLCFSGKPRYKVPAVMVKA